MRDIMQNPCEECIVKVNCTAICGEKVNYKTLLQHALAHRGNDQKHRTKYASLYHKTITEETSIRYRKAQLNCDDGF
jgi:hypothetical protein